MGGVVEGGRAGYDSPGYPGALFRLTLVLRAKEGILILYAITV
jgi:hypothetical protein